MFVLSKYAHTHKRSLTWTFTLSHTNNVYARTCKLTPQPQTCAYSHDTILRTTPQTQHMYVYRNPHISEDSEGSKLADASSGSDSIRSQKTQMKPSTHLTQRAQHSTSYHSCMQTLLSSIASGSGSFDSTSVSPTLQMTQHRPKPKRSTSSIGRNNLPP